MQDTKEWYAVFGILQTGMLEVCEGKRQNAVNAIDTFNEGQDQLVKKLKPKHWYWPF